MSAIAQYLLSDNCFVNSDDELEVAGVKVKDLAAEYGTPLFVYDEDHIRARCREAVSTMGRHATYASKAFITKHMAKVVANEGMGIDVSTGGELHVCLEAGVDPATLTMHGNNKSTAELQMAIHAGVGKIAVDSFDEIDRLETIVASNGAQVPNVLIRVTPGIKAETHKFVSTGQDDSKFGFNVSIGDAAVAVSKAAASTAMNLVGVHCHIGSQVLVADSFYKAVEVMADFVLKLDVDIQELVMGGGIGVPYVDGEHAPSITEWAIAIQQAATDAGLTIPLGIEPGRSIAAAAGMTVYTVGTIKKIPGVRNYVAVDGGMSDNPRPIMYDSGYEAFDPTKVSDERSMVANVVGKHCESGDIVVADAQVPADTKVGDLLVTPVTGAYGFGMSSNYNGVPRAAVVFVRDGQVHVSRRRETYDDLLLTDLD